MLEAIAIRFLKVRVLKSLKKENKSPQLMATRRHFEHESTQLKCHGAAIQDLMRLPTQPTRSQRVRPGEACSSGAKQPSSPASVASLLLVAMPFVPSSFLLLVVRPGAPSEPLVASLLLVVRPGAPSSVLAPSSTARSP